MLDKKFINWLRNIPASGLFTVLKLIILTGFSFALLRVFILGVQLGWPPPHDQTSLLFPNYLLLLDSIVPLSFVLFLVCMGLFFKICSDYFSKNKHGN